MPLTWSRGIVGLHHPAFDAATRVPEPVKVLLLNWHPSIHRGRRILPIDLLASTGFLILSASSAYCPKWGPWLPRYSLRSVSIPLSLQRQLLDVPGLDYPSIGHGNDVLWQLESSSQIDHIKPSPCHYPALRLVRDSM